MIFCCSPGFSAPAISPGLRNFLLGSGSETSWSPRWNHAHSTPKLGDFSADDWNAGASISLCQKTDLNLKQPRFEAV